MIKHIFLIIILCLSTVFLTNCKKNTITVIKTPKQPVYVAKIEQNKELTWTIPSHWQQQESTGMRKASYTVASTSTPALTADFSIIAFPGDVGGLLANVNRWRNQLNLSSITQIELEPLLEHIDVNNLHIDQLILTGTQLDPQTKDTQSTLVAICKTAKDTYFFKLTGFTSIINQEKNHFITLINSISYESN